MRSSAGLAPIVEQGVDLFFKANRGSSCLKILLAVGTPSLHDRFLEDGEDLRSCV